MTDNERARIAATTIWLPVPPTRSLFPAPSMQCFSTPVSISSAGENRAPCGSGGGNDAPGDQGEGGGGGGGPLSANPLIRRPRMSDLASPIVACKTPGAAAAPLESTGGKTILV